ncbi:MAG: 4-hydroxythreonine-4-phosphate dehydrogenase PdxA [Clostridiales bacterium]|jgi:4-hydroxythreonine-4-phosphate dehydrogenase|nr:4-hydroxythreonine-4-phosphate dehydrogenase PdxA [Clostridiales bacterium]
MKPVIGITMGDPAGIGGEIAVKALALHRDIYEKCVPVVIGDRQALLEANEFSGTRLTLHKIDDVSRASGEPGTLDYIDMAYLAPGSFVYKKVQKLCGEASFQYVVRGIELAMEKKLHAVVTGPINKEAINEAGHHYSGHTEIFADYTHTKDYAMLLMSASLRVIHVTTHCSMRDACDRITKERVLTVIRLAREGLGLLGFSSPRIGVAGLNAHCSENGLFGWEEERAIIPAILAAKAEGIDADGPVPPDTVFVKAQAGQYDVVVAMYHDQGHIPLKLSGFKLDLATNRYSSVSGVNCTIGLPIIRSSVDHGTAFGKAGEGRANEESLVDAIDVGLIMAKNKFS